MKKHVLIIVLLAATLTGRSQMAIGEWQDHFSYKTARSVYAGKDRVYAATRMSLFYYDKSEFSTGTMSKVTGLSDAGISTFAYDDETECLVIAYTNSNIDIRRDGTVHNLSDIKYSSISGDKTIYHIRFSEGRAYLATGFGVVVVDLDRYEIIETYYLGENGNHAVVYDVAFSDSLIYAGTDNSFLYAPRHSSRLHVYDEWTRETDSLFAGMSIYQLAINPKHDWLMMMGSRTSPDSLTSFFQSANGRWGSWGSGDINSLRCHNGRIVLTRNHAIEVYSDNYQLVERVTDLPSYGLVANDADFDGDSTLWIAHNWAGLVRLPWHSDHPSAHQPEGPLNDDYVYGLTATYDNVYMAPGGKRPTYEGLCLDGDLHAFNGRQWYRLDRGGNGTLFRDVLQVAVDPEDSQHLFASSWGHGVIEVRNGVLQQVYDQNNTDNALKPYISGDYVHYRVSGMAMDDEGNLWMTNSLSSNGLVVRYSDGTWKSFGTNAVLYGSTTSREIDKIIWDSVNRCLWFAGRANKIYVHNGEDKIAYVNPNQGSKLETHSVNCLVQDRQGDIWFGTDKGIKVIYDGYKAFQQGGQGELAPVSCSNILYNEDGINEYLMAYENITCIAVDGANRKWVGTASNGLYLISANGLEQLEHFTSANSPLVSDKIAALAVHPVTGVLYVGTDKGLQSYRSTATVGDLRPWPEIRVFPNPVRPDYDGPIAIRGFTRDGLVHITDARGHTVFSTTAYGGQVIWDGRTLNGEKAASGPYFVFASDASGKHRSVAKILIVR